MSGSPSFLSIRTGGLTKLENGWTAPPASPSGSPHSSESRCPRGWLPPPLTQDLGMSFTWAPKVTAPVARPRPHRPSLPRSCRLRGRVDPGLGLCFCGNSQLGPQLVPVEPLSCYTPKATQRENHLLSPSHSPLWPPPKSLSRLLKNKKRCFKEAIPAKESGRTECGTEAFVLSPGEGTGWYVSPKIMRNQQHTG